MKKLTLLIAVLLAINTFAQVPSYVPTNGLIGWLPLNGNSNDESGNGNNGAVHGATLTSDRFGIVNKAYSFDGLNDWIEISNHFLNTNSSHTISIWWKTNDSTKTNQTIFNTNPHPLENLAFHYSSSSPNPPNGISVGIGNGQSWSIIWPDTCQITNSNFNQNWHNIVWVKSGLQNWKVYYDLNLVFNFNSSQNSVGQIANLRFGAENNGVPNGGANFIGKLDDIGIWNRALTDCEIKDLYNSQLGSNNTTSSQTQTALDTYTWPINNQTYTQSGIYSDTLVNAAGCDSIVTLNLTLNYTGINENNSSSLVISPNPTTGSFSMHGLEQLGTITSLRIIDNNGKVVQVLDPKATQFACSTLKTGVYFLEVTGVKTNDIVKLVIQ